VSRAEGAGRSAWQGRGLGVRTLPLSDSLKRVPLVAWFEDEIAGFDRAANYGRDPLQ
jgi:hypothetical protein